MATRGKLSKIDAAYLAGFIDGEGCIAIFKKNTPNGWSPQYQLYIGITNTNKKVIDWAYSKMGGYLYEKKRSNATKHRIAYTLSVRGWESVIYVLNQIYPYLRVKKLQAELMYEFIENVSKLLSKAPKKRLSERELKYRNSFYERSKELNRRGN